MRIVCSDCLLAALRETVGLDGRRTGSCGSSSALSLASIHPFTHLVLLLSAGQSSRRSDWCQRSCFV